MNIERPPTLGEREVTDMIDDLRESEKVVGTCGQHSLVVRSAILGHRQSEQIQFGVTMIQMQLQMLMKEQFKEKGDTEEYRDDAKNFRFNFLKVFGGSWKGYSSYDICKILFVLFVCGILSYIVYEQFQLQKQVKQVKQQTSMVSQP